jgi:hypothetical protein
MNQTSHLSSPLPLILLCGDLRVRPAVTAAAEEDINTEITEMDDKNKHKNNHTSANTSGAVSAVSASTSAVLSVDDWIVFRCDAQVASELVILRRRLDSAFLKLVAQPANGLSSLNASETDAVETLSAVLKSAFQHASTGKPR